MENCKELVERVINGDMHAFETIYQATYRQVYYTCMSFLNNEQNVLDMMQETYITALTHLKQLENPERIAAWLNRIAVNKCRDFLTRKMPALLGDDGAYDSVLEENDNFLPESYVMNAEKRKIILSIMQDELTAAQYQTVIMYYFDEMSVAEIANCMECPDGTVKYRLASARGRIKQAVERYEDTSGVKLYSAGGVALLTAILTMESQQLVIPNVLNSVFSTVGMAATSAGAATKTAGVVGKSFSAGVKGFFSTLKAKLIVGVASVAVVGSVAAGIAIHKSNKDSELPYQTVDKVLVDNDYMTLTMNRVYEPGYIPSFEEVNYPIKEEGWNTEDSVLYCTLVNKTDIQYYVELKILSANGESMDFDNETEVSFYIEPNREFDFCVNNHYMKLQNTGRDSLTNIRAEIYAYTIDFEQGIEIPIVYEVKEIELIEEQAPKYKRKNSEKDQVIVDNDQVRISYVGSCVEDYTDCNSIYIYPLYYVENKTDHDLLIRTSGEKEYDGYQIVMRSYHDITVFAGESGYITQTIPDCYDITDEEKYRILSEMFYQEIPFNVTFTVYDYSDTLGKYMNERFYMFSHNLESIFDVLSPSEKQYSAEIVMYDYMK